MFIMKRRVHYSEIGQNGQATLYSLLNYLQDCAIAHSESIDVGIRKLQGLNRAWILSSWQIEILRLPEFNEEIEIGTYPYDFRHFYGYRNLYIKGQDGEYLAKVNSIWIFMDMQNLRPARFTKEFVAPYQKEPRLLMNYEERKIAQIDGEGQAKEAIPVMHYHVDTNGHMNNACYVQLAEEYLPEEFKVSYIQVEYKKAAVYGDVIYPIIYHVSDELQVELNSENGDCYAIIVFK